MGWAQWSTEPLQYKVLSSIPTLNAMLHCPPFGGASSAACRWIPAVGSSPSQADLFKSCLPQVLATLTPPPSLFFPVCRDLTRSMQMDTRSGLITFTSRSPPKVMRHYKCCSQCGRQHELGAFDPTWELWLDPTAPEALLPEMHLCVGCALGEVLHPTWAARPIEGGSARGGGRWQLGLNQLWKL
jgi:hypothetical protein